jgi:hypothetical protein
MIPIPNQSGAIFGPTLGVARDMQPVSAAPVAQGGGDLNGTSATSILFAHAGTAGQQIGVPRNLGFGSTIAGVTN